MSWFARLSLALLAVASVAGQAEDCCSRLVWRCSSNACVTCSDDTVTVGLSVPAPGSVTANVELLANPTKPAWAAAGPINTLGLGNLGSDPRVAPVVFASPAPTLLTLTVNADASPGTCVAGTSQTSPAATPRGSKALAVGPVHSCVLRSDGSAVCSGYTSTSTCRRARRRRP